MLVGDAFGHVGQLPNPRSSCEHIPSVLRTELVDADGTTWDTNTDNNVNADR